jgi:hypothetical protein
MNGCGMDRGATRTVAINRRTCDTLDLRVNFAEQKAVVDGFTAYDFVTQVRIDIRVCRFLIGKLGDVKLIVQSAINE